MAMFVLSLGGEVLLLASLCVVAIYVLFLQPPKYPIGVPSIPFWVALLPLVQDVDQQDIFNQYIRKPLEEHGAVKIFFGSQWNILVHRPAYIAAMFKNEDDFQKSGNQKKIPKSVLASLLGDNIISSHGDVWRLYQEIIKPGLQRSFNDDAAVLFKNAKALCDILFDQQLKSSGGGITVQEIFQRYTIANFSQVFLRFDFGTMKASEAYINKLQLSLKREIFKPVFMNFPFLDSLGLPTRERTRSLASHFTDQLVRAAEESAQNRRPREDSVGLGDLLIRARDAGKLNQQQFRDNVTVMFVAGQENPQLSLISTIYLLAKHPEIQERLRKEIQNISEETPSSETLQEMPLLTTVVLESLRLLPPIGQLINRKAARPLILADGIHITQGSYLGYNCYSTNRDSAAWGPDADQFRPERWGLTSPEIQKTYRRRKARAEFISFHGGRRACLGERFAMLELRATIFVLCQHLRWKLDPSWPDRLTPAGPICPRALRIVLERVVQGDNSARPNQCG